MKASRRTSLVAGVALIALTNVVALSGAAYNRRGNPDSVLTLTQRELRLPFVGSRSNENSGLALELGWRVASDDAPPHADFPFGGYGRGTPAWLDAPKMASLGFDTRGVAKGFASDPDSHFQRQLARDVLLVLELDGPAYRHSLERAVRAARAAASKDEPDRTKLQVAQDAVERETHENSRLFVIDAGLDPAALRRQYPDRAKYAIVHGRVRPAHFQPGDRACGAVEGLSTEAVNVPHDMRSAFVGLGPGDVIPSRRNNTRFEAQVAFGQRLEPWLLAATRR